MEVREVEALWSGGESAPAGHYKVYRTDHPAANMIADVSTGDGASMTIINPQSFGNGGPGWVMRYGNPIPIRYHVAELLESYDYLLSGDITTKEAIRRLRVLRGARADLAAHADGGGDA